MTPSARPRDLIVRPARPLDLDRLVSLWSEYVSYHERIGRERIAPQGAELRAREALREDISDRFSQVLVAEVAKEVVGYTLGRTVPIPAMYEGRRLGVIHELIVSESARGRGVGRKLVAGLTEWFRERRAHKIEITILAENKDAMEFWERLGYRLSGHRFSRPM